MKVFACALLLATPVLAVNMEVSLKSSLTLSADGPKNRPVSKVISLLKDMLKQLEKEATEDEEVYDTMACWCETNDKEKTKSVADAESRVSDLTSKVKELTASSSRLNNEINNLQTEVAENQEALDKSTAIRRKELAEFNTQEKDLIQSIGSLKSAVVVLSKHNSLVQVSHKEAEEVSAGMKRLMRTHASLLASVLTHDEREEVFSFAQASSDAPQSGEIFGILKQMKETFENNLSSSQKEETANQKSYEELNEAKADEIAAGKEQLNSKKQELADIDEKNAQAKEDMKDTRRSLAADEKFLAMLKKKCSMTDSEWEERQKSRHLEMESVSKALAMLSSDDAQDLFSKAFKFVQMESSVHSERRAEASRVLSALAQRLGNPRLAALAVTVRLNAFGRVKKAIDDMVQDLLNEKKDEIKKRDFCISEFNTNALQAEKKERSKKDLSAKLDDMKLTIGELTEAIDTLKSDIQESQTQLKKAGEDRAKQNKEFQLTVADQRATQKLLAAALKMLKGFYSKKAKAAFVQDHEADGAAPPPGFDSYKKNSGSTSVMGMLAQIMNDAKAMEAEATRDEADAQKAFDDQVKSTNNIIKAKSKDIVNKSDNKAKKEAEFAEAKSSKAAVMLELEQLANYKKELHDSCDFVVKNFAIRQTARDEEIEALREAKSALSGATL